MSTSTTCSAAASAEWATSSRQLLRRPRRRRAGDRARKEGRDMGVGLRITLEEVGDAASRRRSSTTAWHRAPIARGRASARTARLSPAPNAAARAASSVFSVRFWVTCRRPRPARSATAPARSIENPCPECEGQGRVPDRQRVTVEVPAGIRDGQQLRVARLRRSGHPGRTGGRPHRHMPRATARILRTRRRRFARAREHILHPGDRSVPKSRSTASCADEKVQVRIPAGLPKRAGRSREGLRHAAPEERYPRQYVRPRERRHPREDHKEATRAAREARGRDGRRGGGSPKPVAKAARRLQLAHLKGKVAKTHVTATFLP